VSPEAVIEHFNVFKDVGLGLQAGRIVAMIINSVFKVAKKLSIGALS